MTSSGYRTLGMPTQVLVFTAAALSLFAALVHVWVMRVHFEHWWGYGLMFLVFSIAQGLYSVAALSWPRAMIVLLGGIFGNLMIIVAYTITRTVRIPLVGPHEGQVGSVGTIDLASKTAEAMLVLVLMTLVWSWWRATVSRAGA